MTTVLGAPQISQQLLEDLDRVGRKYERWTVPAYMELTGEYAIGVTLVVEVVSESNRDHDFETKRAEYASAGIPEYWIVDPEDRQVTVLTLRGDGYATHGLFEDGAQATSLLLPALKIDVSALFAE